MRKNLAILIAILGWFAVITQFILMIQHRKFPVLESIIQFFSYFTILTNIMVAIYFTCQAMPEIKRPKITSHPGILTAITVYITIVCVVYQVALRSIWDPKGLALIVDELLHTIIPILVIIFWYRFENNQVVSYAQIPKWCLYPLIYLVYVLIRGSIADFYPYPFVDVTNLGLQQTGINSVVLFGIFVLFSAFFVFIGKKMNRN